MRGMGVEKSTRTVPPGTSNPEKPRDLRSQGKKAGVLLMLGRSRAAGHAEVERRRQQGMGGTSAKRSETYALTASFLPFAFLLLTPIDQTETETLKSRAERKVQNGETSGLYHHYTVSFSQFVF